MLWTKRVLISFPFVVAVVLALLVAVADRGHSQRMLGYVFLFGAPWGGLLDFIWICFSRVEIPEARWLQDCLAFVYFLLIPAAMYALCFWVLFAARDSWKVRRAR